MRITRSRQARDIVAEVRGERHIYVLDLVDAWAADVSLLATEAARPLDPSADSRTVFDFIGTLHLRNRLDRALRAIDGDVALPSVAVTDELFRRFTMIDESQALHRGWNEVPLEPWWWQRIPIAGPVFEEIKSSW